MNIFYISNIFPSKKSNDNYGIFCKNVYDALNDEKFKVTHLAVIQGKSFNRVYNVFRYIFLIFKIYVIGLFCSKSFDVIYFQYVWFHVFLSILIIKKWRRNAKKLILNFHGEDLLGFLNEPNSKKNNFLVESADRIIFPSVYFKNLFLEKYSATENKLFVSPSGGVNKEIFFADNKSIDFREHRIVFCSRFAKDKGWDDFINAAVLIHKKRIDFQFILIGYGEELAFAKKLINQNSAESYIKILEGLTQQKIAEIYRKSILFVFPTRLSESLGLVALEAMSCGLAVVGSNIAALPEYIKNGHNGLLFEKGNPNDLSDKIIMFLKLSSEKKEQFSLNAFETSKQYEQNKVLADLKDNLIKL